MYDWTVDYLTRNWTLFQEIYENLADELSKAILDELVSAKINGCGNELLRLADDRQYFNELTYCLDSKDEVFVDCGAFNGDTILKFNAFTDGKFQKIYAFEPNTESMSKLRENTKHLLGEIEFINIRNMERRRDVGI